MSRYYLRLEGMNFDHFLADTQDLSTIRGGGLLLLEAARRVTKETELGLEEIGTGASTGLFSFDAESDEEAARRRDRLVDWLNSDDDFRHATFSVDVLPAGKDFRQDKEALLALNRWRQMASPSLAVPTPATHSAKPCALNRLRPDAKHSIHDGLISDSVSRRREYGKDRKQKFYRDETGVDVEAGFSETLEHLAQDPARGNLHGKMAVIYIDGNSFGKLNADYVDSVPAQKELDEYLRQTRRDALREIVETARDRPAWRESTGKRPLRLETLMWGGDEMAWVVPAWTAWEVVDIFFRRKWWYRRPLSHACGVVFCHHKAPIHRMRAIAEKLAGLVKDDVSRAEDLVAYEVLESYDDVGDDLRDYRKRVFPGLEPKDLVLAPRHLATARDCFARLCRHLPRRQVHAAARAVLREPKHQVSKEDIARWLPAPARADLDSLLGDLGAHGGEATAWIHVSQLWDYLEPTTPAAGEEERHD